MLMQPWQNVLTVIAIGFALATLWPLPPLYRLSCSVAAFGLILIVLVYRLRDHSRKGPGKRESIKDMEDRIAQIRADRERRYGRR